MSDSSDEEKLKSILNSMDIPVYRMDDYNWLARNIGIRNSNHPRYGEAKEILKKLVGSKMRKNDFRKIFGEPKLQEKGNKHEN